MAILNAPHVINLSHNVIQKISKFSMSGQVSQFSYEICYWLTLLTNTCVKLETLREVLYKAVDGYSTYKY